MCFHQSSNMVVTRMFHSATANFNTSECSSSLASLPGCLSAVPMPVSVLRVLMSSQFMSAPTVFIKLRMVELVPVVSNRAFHVHREQLYAQQIPLVDCLCPKNDAADSEVVSCLVVVDIVGALAMDQNGRRVRAAKVPAHGCLAPLPRRRPEVVDLVRVHDDLLDAHRVPRVVGIHAVCHDVRRRDALLLYVPFQISRFVHLTPPLAPARRRLRAIAASTLARTSGSNAPNVSVSCQFVFQVISPVLLKVVVRRLLATTAADFQHTNVHGSLRRSGSSFVSAAWIAVAAAVSFLFRHLSSRVFRGPAYGRMWPPPKLTSRRHLSFASWITYRPNAGSKKAT